MAIDTENKRRSVQAYWLGLARPVADGAIDVSDRATSAWFYSGLSYGPLVVQVTKRIPGLGFIGRIASCVLVFFLFYDGTT